MDLQSALRRLRKGESLDRNPSSLQQLQNNMTGKDQANPCNSSLFTVDDWDSFSFDEDDGIFKESDGISFSPPASQTCSDSQSVGVAMEVEPTSTSTNISDISDGGLGQNSCEDKNESSGLNVRTSVQKLKTFQFVKRDRNKRSCEDHVEVPPTKKQVLLEHRSDTHRDVFVAKVTDRSGELATTTGGSTGCVATVGGMATVSKATRTATTPQRDPRKVMADFFTSSSGRGTKDASSNVATPSNIGHDRISANSTPTSTLTTPLHSTNTAQGISNRVSCGSISNRIPTQPSLPYRNRSSSSSTTTESTPVSVRGMSSSIQHSNIHTPPKRPPTTTHLSPSISTTHVVALTTPSTPHNLSASLRTTYDRLITNAPLLSGNTGLTGLTRSQRPSLSVHSTPSNRISSDLLKSTKSTPLSSTPESSCSNNISKTVNSNLSSQLTPRVSMTMSSTQVATPQTVSCPSRRTRLSTPMSAVVCMPGDTCSGSDMEILRTPVPVPHRKFPGPAGLLPRLVPGQSMDNICIAPPTTPAPVSTPRLARLPSSRIHKVSETNSSNGGCGGGEDMEAEHGEFSQGPWVEMLQDLDLNDSRCSALLDYSIAQAVRQFGSRKLRNGKVVHLRVILKSISLSGRSASGVLKDPTGEIMCTLHNHVLEEYKKELQVGAVLVLRQVSMFSPGPRRQYLNITPANVVRMYPPDGTIKTDSPLVLSEFERLQSQDSEDLGLPPVPVPFPPKCKLMKTQPLHSSLFSSSSNIMGGQGSRMADEDGSRLEIVMSRVRSAGNTETSSLTDGRRGGLGYNESDNYSTTTARPRVVGNVGVVYGSCEPNTSAKRSRDFLRSHDSSISARNSSDNGASRSCDNGGSRSCDNGASRSCDTDVMFLTDICEDEFNDLFSDMAD